MGSDVALLALEQYAETLQELPGVQGVGVDDDGLVVYVDDAASVPEHVPAELVVVTDDCVEVSVPVRVSVIGPVSPE